MDTFAFHIQLTPPKPWAEIAITWLAELDFSAFEETQNGLIAYTPLADFEEHELLKLKIREWAKEKNISESTVIERIEQKNWNALWESDFQPVNVDEKLWIVAPFHEKPETKGLVVVIQPQMSFGTGHHQTTWMMSKALLEMNTLPNAVLDMGTGTGILAILAEKLGAKEITAIDIEEWSAVNTRENGERNGCKNIQTFHGDINLIDNKKFGLILANINKNVLKLHLPRYKNSLLSNGVLIISGFFETDVAELMGFAENLGFRQQKIVLKETWAAIQFELKK